MDVDKREDVSIDIQTNIHLLKLINTEQVGQLYTENICSSNLFCFLTIDTLLN